MGLFGKRKSRRNNRTRRMRKETKSETAPVQSSSSKADAPSTILPESPVDPSHLNHHPTDNHHHINILQEEEKKEEPLAPLAPLAMGSKTPDKYQVLSSGKTPDKYQLGGTPSGASFSMASMAAASAIAASPMARGLELPAVEDASREFEEGRTICDSPSRDLEEEEGVLGASLPKLTPQELAQRVAPDDEDHRHVDEEDEEEDDGDSVQQIVFCAMELPPALRSPLQPLQAVSPGHRGDFQISTTNDLRRSPSGPPTEIIMDLTAVPPSPMRDPIDRKGSKSPPEDLLLAQFERRTHSPTPDWGETFHPKQVDDADRLVRIILGRNHDQHLEHGSVLKAIKTFAVMKQELIRLRQQQELADGDPPAILTNLTSPATTKNTGTIPSTPAQTTFSPSPRHLTTTFSPGSQTHNSKELRKTRSALILAAKKCHSLEQQLKEANEKLIRMEDANEPEQPKERKSLALELRISHLEAENQALKQQQQQQASISSTPTANPNQSLEETQDHVEEILSKLQGIPASALSQEDCQRIQQCFTDMIHQTKKNTEVSSEGDKYQQAQRRIASLEEQLRQQQQLPKSPSTEEESSSQLLALAKEEIRQKEERIAELEAAGLPKIHHPHALQETSNLTASDRLRSLDEEHKRLRGTVRVLQDTVDM